MIDDEVYEETRVMVRKAMDDAKRDTHELIARIRQNLADTRQPECADETLSSGTE